MARWTREGDSAVLRSLHDAPARPRRWRRLLLLFWLYAVHFLAGLGIAALLQLPGFPVRP